MINRSALLSLPAAALLMLGGCTTQPTAPVSETSSRPQLQPASYQPDQPPGYDCRNALPDVQRLICTDQRLAGLHLSVQQLYHQRLGELDVPALMLLQSNQRQWLLSRFEQCPQAEDSQRASCLEGLYGQRLAALRNWPAVASRASTQPHALASYAEYRLAEGSAPFCNAFTDRLNSELRRNGLPLMSRLPGVEALADSLGGALETDTSSGRLRIDIHNSGPYGGQRMRPTGLSLNGERIMDSRTLPAWVAQQPNYGGRAHVSSSQTGDYGAIQIFREDGQLRILVNETWGFYSPAARGESAFAGLYALQGGSLQPLCLYRSYLTPPRTDLLAGLPRVQQLQGLLTQLAGQPLNEVAQHERRDQHQFRSELQWTLLNLPLLGGDQLERHGRRAALQQQHDLLLERLFQWSERNLLNKQLYRQLVPVLAPTHGELRGVFADQGLNPGEAEAAADLLIHAMLADAMNNLPLDGQRVDLPLPAFADYRSRYRIATEPGELERGRQFQSLHSVILNGAPWPVVNDFIGWERGQRGAQTGLGADQDSAVHAAVANPQLLQALLQRGFDINAQNAWGRTPLMLAARLDQPESLRLLLAGGADVHLRTRRNQSAGAGGMDRNEATGSPQTALLLAASHAGAETIRGLLDAGANKEEWGGYQQQVCSALDGNARLDAAQRDSLRQGLCAVSYAPAPVTRQPVANLREGDELVITEDAQTYRIRLQQRSAHPWFSRPLQMTAQRMSRDLPGVGRSIGMAAVRRAGVRLEGPFTLYFADLTAASGEGLRFEAGFPVRTTGNPVGGYQQRDLPALQVLSVFLEPDQQNAEAAWRALYSAAYTQGFEPTHEGLVVSHTRARRATEYQLVVRDRHP